MLKRILASSVLVAALLTFVGAAQRAPARLTGGTGTLYIGGWPNKIFVIDEATEKVTSTIDTVTGAPTRMTLSKDKKRFYIVNAPADEVELIDIATHKSMDHFTLSDGRKKT